MNTQFLMKTSLIAAIAAASMAPLASQASSKNGMNACIDTFVKEHVPQGHPVRIVTRTRLQTPFLGFSGPQTYEVKAKGSKSGDLYGSAKCIVDRKGEVLALHVEGTPVRLAKGDKSTDVSGG